MADSLRDQMLALGFKPAPREKQPAKPAQPQRPPAGRGQRPDRAPRPAEAPRKGEPALADAYAARARAEREERVQAQREIEAKAREKKERRERLTRLLEGKALNDPQADTARHFPHGTRIRRAYVTADQLARLNAGELGIVQLAGRYLVVERAIALQAAEISGEALVLLPEPGSPGEDDVPPDLVW
jgi:uncharacterized protein YaiL (DUF2058 family)